MERTLRILARDAAKVAGRGRDAAKAAGRAEVREVEVDAWAAAAVEPVEIASVGSAARPCLMDGESLALR